MNPTDTPENHPIAFVASDARSLLLFRKNAMLALKEMGFPIHVMAPQSVFATKLVNLGFEFHHLPLKPYGTDLLEEAGMVRTLYRLYKKNNIALAFHYTAKINIQGSLAAGRLNIPSVAVQTGLGELPLLKPGLKRYLIHRAYALALRWSEEVWFLNHKDRNYFLKHALAPIRKLKQIQGEGLDLDHYSVKDKSFHNNPLTFLFLGRLLESKGVNEFIEAARQIKAQYDDVRFQIVGIFNLDHPSSIEAEQLYRWQKDGIIEFLGERMDVRPVMEAADCLVHPSYYNEGMSRVLMEAAAMELPVITTDQIGCREMVRDRVSGFIVPKQDTAALVRAIKEVIHMEPTDRMVLGKNGRRHIEAHFGDEEVIRTYLRTAHHLLELPWKEGQKVMAAGKRIQENAS